MPEAIDKIVLESYGYNVVNLRRMALYISTLKQEQFDMRTFRDGQEKFRHCDSVGCVIGHCTALDDPKNIIRDKDGYIMFSNWSETFTGLNMRCKEYEWCFGTIWATIDNTPDGASKRILYFLEHLKVPKNFGRMNAKSLLQYYEHIEIRKNNIETIEKP